MAPFSHPAHRTGQADFPSSRACTAPVVARYRERDLCRYFRADAAFPVPTPRSTRSWKPKATSTRSGCRRTACCRTVSAICSSALLAAPDHGPAILRQLQLSGPKLDDATPRRGQGRVAPRRAFPRVGFIVTNLSRPVERVVAFYNKRGTCRAMDQGRQERDQVDATVMLLVRRQRSASSVAHAGLRSRQLHAELLALPEAVAHGR